jgi:glycosyltransferase involved in cell wall biosynthesis
MSHDTPQVTVGLPVWNGEAFLERTIESILCQSFEDFELIISDNASNDATETICRAFAARDRRIRYYRNPENVGAALNFNRLVPLARAHYFKWAAHDDLCAPSFLEQCVAVLDREPAVVLCHSLIQVIDEHGHVVSQPGPTRWRIDSPDPRERFFEIVMALRLGTMAPLVFGVIRTQALRNTALVGGYPESDEVLLAELALAGRFRQVPDVLFSVRRHPDSYSSIHGRVFRDKTSSGIGKREAAVESLRRRLEWFNPGEQRTVAFPNWRILVGRARAVLRSDLSWSHRVSCWIALARRSWWFRSTFAEDIYIACYALTQRLNPLHSRNATVMGRRGSWRGSR